MINYEVRPVVSDWGIFEDGKLKLIVNYKKYADPIKIILERDQAEFQVLNHSINNQIIKAKELANSLYLSGAQRMIEILIKELRYSNELEKDYLYTISKILSFYYDGVISDAFALSSFRAAYEEKSIAEFFRSHRDAETPFKKCSGCVHFEGACSQGVCHITEKAVFASYCCNNYEAKND